MFVVGVASRRGFVIVLSLCEDKTSFPPPLFSQINLETEQWDEGPKDSNLDVSDNVDLATL